LAGLLLDHMTAPVLFGWIGSLAAVTGLLGFSVREGCAGCNEATFPRAKAFRGIDPSARRYSSSASSIRPAFSRTNARFVSASVFSGSRASAFRNIASASPLLPRTASMTPRFTHASG